MQPTIFCKKVEDFLLGGSRSSLGYRGLPKNPTALAVWSCQNKQFLFIMKRLLLDCPMSTASTAITVDFARHESFIRWWISILNKGITCGNGKSKKIVSCAFMMIKS
jgi:hypothetical protein